MNVYIAKKSPRSKKWVVMDSNLERPWANEYFDSVDEAMNFIKQNNLTYRP